MTKDELLRTIAQTAEEGWTALNVSKQGSTELPPEIGKGLIFSCRDMMKIAHRLIGGNVR